MRDSVLQILIILEMCAHAQSSFSLPQNMLMHIDTTLAPPLMRPVNEKNGKE